MKSRADAEARRMDASRVDERHGAGVPWDAETREEGRPACLRTREDYERLLRDYLTPLLGRFSPLCARIDVGSTAAIYEEATVGMEAFARPLWGLAPLWAGGGSWPEMEEAYRRGLIAGCDPEGPEYWGVCHDNDQRFVEMAAIAYALVLAPRVLWDPLTRKERDRVVAWLSQINAHEVPNNNWLFFSVLVNVALRRLGEPYDAAALERNLDRIDGFWRGDGWYTDGPAGGYNGMLDYYNPFALHFYGLVYARFAGEKDPVRAERFVTRARIFARDFVWLFSERGEAVPYGRSQTYRFAQVAFFSACAGLGIDLVGGEGPSEAGPLASTGAGSGAGAADEAGPLTQATVKGIVGRNLAFWAGCPTRDTGGVLTVGYHYPCQHMAEGYNAPGSPYWAMKAFAPLMLPANDGFWALEPAPLPVADGVRQIAGGEMVVARRGGESTLYVGGRTGKHTFAHTEEKYCKFAYSSRYGFSASVSDRKLAEAAPDSMLALVVGGRVFAKGQTAEHHVEGASVVSVWSPWEGIEVESRVTPTSYGHVRVHRVRLDHACEAYDCGFSFPADSLEEARASGVCRVECGGLGDAWGPGVRGSCDHAVPGDVATGDSGDVATRGPALPLPLVGEATTLKQEPNTNLMCPKTFLNAVRYELSAGESVLVTRVYETV